MRAPALLLCLTLAGCGMGTDAALTAKDAKGAIGAKDTAVEQVATMQLTTITTAAKDYVAANGSLGGFADNLRSTNPSAAVGAVTLTDAVASVRLGAGPTCLIAQLPSGAPTQGPC